MLSLAFPRFFTPALRALLKAPGYSVAAVAILSLCIGANVAIFSVVEATLLRPLPFANPDRLVVLYNAYPKANVPRDLVSLTSYYERRGEIRALSSTAAISEATAIVGERGASTIERVGRVTPEFFRTLGVSLYLGRGFHEDELTYQTDQVAVLGYEYWRAHYAADPHVVGKQLRMDGIPRVIVGVLPPDFKFLSFRAPVFVPLSSSPAERAIAARHAHTVVEIARLAPGATLSDAQAQIDAHNAAHAAEFPAAKAVEDAGFRTIVAPMQNDFVAPIRPVLWLLQAGAGLLLLIGGVNLTNLMLTRAIGRTREVAIRQALGASEAVVARDIVAESLPLGIAGTVLGVGLGWAATRILASLGDDRLPLGADVKIDTAVLMAGVAIGMLTVLGTTLPVLWFNLRSGMVRGLHSESRGYTGSRRVHRLRHAFIVAQVALAFVLLAGAGLLGVSLERALKVSPGFQPDQVVTGRLNLPWNNYPTVAEFRPFFDRLVENVQALPGVEAVGAVSELPVNGVHETDAVSGAEPAHAAGERIAVHNLFGVAGDYFKALRIPVRAGRALNDADARSDAIPCVVDEDFARRHWPDGDALGRQFYRSTGGANDEPPFTIIGIVGAVKQSDLTEAGHGGAVYVPYSRLDTRNYYIVVRTRSAPEALALSLPKAVRAIDPDLPLSEVRTMELRIEDSLQGRRSPAWLAGIFAAAALALAVVGLYGVMAYSVSQRRSEFGIRMALGAQRRQVLALVFGEGLRLIVQGLAIGVAATLLLTDSLSSLLFAVKPHDPIVLGAIGALLALIAMIACLVPARRATRVDPMAALREE